MTATPTPGGEFLTGLAARAFAASNRSFGIPSQAAHPVPTLLAPPATSVPQIGELFLGLVLLHPVFSRLHLNHLMIFRNGSNRIPAQRATTSSPARSLARPDFSRWSRFSARLSLLSKHFGQI